MERSSTHHVVKMLKELFSLHVGLQQNAHNEHKNLNQQTNQHNILGSDAIKDLWNIQIFFFQKL